MAFGPPEEGDLPALSGSLGVMAGLILGAAAGYAALTIETPAGVWRAALQHPLAGAVVPFVALGVAVVVWTMWSTRRTANRKSPTSSKLRRNRNATMRLPQSQEHIKSRNHLVR